MDELQHAVEEGKVDVATVPKKETRQLVDLDRELALKLLEYLWGKEGEAKDLYNLLAQRPLLTVTING